LQKKSHAGPVCVFETGTPSFWLPSPIPASSQGGTRGGSPAPPQGNDRIAALVISLLAMNGSEGASKRKIQTSGYTPVICVFSTVLWSLGVGGGHFRVRHCPCHKHIVRARAPQGDTASCSGGGLRLTGCV
jgi:hypothetical protein